MDHLRALHRLRDAINAHEATRIAANFAEDYSVETPRDPDLAFTGRAQVERNWQAILGRLPDLNAELLRWAVQDDEVWSEWRMSGTASDGGPDTLAGTVIWRTDEDGLVSWARFYLGPVIVGAPKAFSPGPGAPGN